MTSTNRYASMACAIFLMAGFASLAETPVPEMTRPAPVPQVAVTPDMLTALRAETRHDAASWFVAPGANIPNLTNLSAADRETAMRVMAESIKEDGNSDQGSAMRALMGAFPTVSLCREWAYYPPGSEAPRFPFAIEANERLVDALDKMRRNSNGFIDWMLLHQRIVISAQTPAAGGEQFIMDRRIHVDLQADTLLEALEQVETAHNDQYPDAPPLVVSPLSFPTALFEGAPGSGGRSVKLALKTEDTLREIVLAILDQMRDPALRYNLSESMVKEGRFFSLTVSRFDVETNNRMSMPEACALVRNGEERLDGYLRLRAERADISASEPGVVGEQR